MDKIYILNEDPDGIDVQVERYPGGTTIRIIPKKRNRRIR